MSNTVQSLLDAFFVDAYAGPMTVELATQTMGYPMAWEIAPGVVMAVHPFAFTLGLIGPLDRFGYEQRWCYHTLQDLLGAMADWKDANYAGEPQGWHRHLPSGRRRADGREWVQP